MYSMISNALPNDIAALQTLVHNQSILIEELQAQLKILRGQHYGPSSEKMSRDQLSFFEEQDAQNRPESAVEATPTQVQSYERQRGGRRKLPSHLKRVRLEHDLLESDKVCTCGCGEMIRIGEEISEQLDIIPAEVYVLEHVRFKYACKQCANGVKIAPLPKQPIPKSNASPGLLSHLVISKYADALPLHRQVAMLKRYGLEITSSSLSRYMIEVGELVQPLVNLLYDQLFEYHLVQMDETTTQVLKEAGRRAQNKSFVWVARGGPPGKEVVLYQYDPSRSHQVAQKILKSYTGYLQTDGYKAYALLEHHNGITSVGCWAHARRKFIEVKNVLNKSESTGLVDEGLSYIQTLYRIEQEIREASAEERYQKRQVESRPVLGNMRTWLDASLLKAPPKSLIGKAMHYVNHNWEKLNRYLEDGIIPIDNNATENAIRPFVVGRKNWLFSDTPKGAHANANLYTLIETVKGHGIEPYAYLRQVFEKLPQMTTVDEMETLLPWNLKTPDT